MTARSVLGRTVGRTLAAVALIGAVVLGTAVAASATPGIDPFRPIASGPTISTGGSSSPTTTPTTTATSGGTTGTGSGGSTGSATTPTPAPSQGGTSTGSLPFTGSHTMATFLLGLFAIFVGAPMVRAGRRRWDARHWPAC